VLNDTRITFCVDTNVLVEFKPLDQIPWRQIAPNATTIHIVVVTKVGEEMDDHKKKTGRLRRRALEFAQIARRIEESTDGRAMLRESDPQVTIAFAPIYRRPELDGDLYDLDDKDGRIVAEVVRFRRDSPGVVLLADDHKPRRWARQTGLPWERPPESWRREEGPDERDKEIAALKRELGAQPAFSIEFPEAATNDRNELIFEPAPATSCSACRDQLASAILAANPKVSRDKSIARYGLARPDPFRPSIWISHQLTESDLERYEDEYNKFEEDVRWWADNQQSLFDTLRLVLPIGVEITNSGDRAAERVLVELELMGPFHFELHEGIEDVTGGWLTAPSPPRPRGLLPHLELPFVSAQEPGKPHVFYLLDGPESDEPASRLVWRCEEFRHGQTFILPSIVRATREAARGALKARISSAVVAKAVEATAVLICLDKNSERNKFCSSLERRIALFPTQYQEPVRRALAAATHDCEG
jgi:hypothetical protein